VIESIGVGLILAVVSAVTFIAYKHPTVYRQTYLGVVVFVSAICLFLCIFQLGAITWSAYTIGQMAGHQDAGTLPQIATEAVTLVTLLKWLAVTASIGAMVVAYLFLLRRLRAFLPEEPPNHAFEADGSAAAQLKR